MAKSKIQPQTVHRRTRWLSLQGRIHGVSVDEISASAHAHLSGIARSDYTIHCQPTCQNGSPHCVRDDDNTSLGQPHSKTMSLSSRLLIFYLRGHYSVASACLLLVKTGSNAHLLCIPRVGTTRRTPPIRYAKEPPVFALYWLPRKRISTAC